MMLAVLIPYKQAARVGGGAITDLGQTASLQSQVFFSQKMNYAHHLKMSKS